MPIPKVLVIAGSDSSGGAGLEADQKTLAAHGVYAMTATTALTAQNTQGVDDIHITPPKFVGKQIESVMEDGFMDGVGGVVKIGMLASAETVDIVAKTLKRYQGTAKKDLKLVVDPVMVATSGAQLLPGDAVRVLREELLPITYILTPNFPEATLLLRDADIEFKSPNSLNDLKVLATALHRLGPPNILLKGGHMPLNKHTNTAASSSDPDADKVIIDILSTASSTTPEIFTTPFHPSPNTHGTGCTLASAIAANLALHPTEPLPHSIRTSITYVSSAISTSHTLQLNNHGHGPTNHFHSIVHLLYTPSSFLTYLITHPTISPIWHHYITHPFSTALGRGTLPLTQFKSYLIQDYLYLTHFARTYSLAGYKSTTMTDITACSEIVSGIRKEMQLHVQYCSEEFGMDQASMENAKESQATTVYSRYVLDVGMQGDLLALLVALAPCLIGYAVVAERLVREGKREGNRYWRWVEMYSGEEYMVGVRKGREMVEALVRRDGAVVGGRLETLVGVFRRATELECGFWEDGGFEGMEGEGGNVNIAGQEMGQRKEQVDDWGGMD